MLKKIKRIDIDYEKLNELLDKEPVSRVIDTLKHQIQIYKKMFQNIIKIK